MYKICVYTAVNSCTWMHKELTCDEKYLTCYEYDIFYNVSKAIWQAK